MQKHILRSLGFLLLCSSVSSCFNYRRLITDEVVLNDQNSITGTIEKVDSLNVRIKKADESMVNIPWSDVDTIKGKKLKTFFCGLNTGYYKTPYFSMFRNESFTPRSGGLQIKGGFAYRGNNMLYGHLTIIPAQPYGVTKIGMGYQNYLGKTTYLKKNSFFIGMEANLMSIQYNNGPQFAFEPFTGFERRLSERIRLHVKLQPQFNFSNKNNGTGLSFTLGVHFMNRNLKRYYTTLNKEHRLPRK